MGESGRVVESVAAQRLAQLGGGSVRVGSSAARERVPGQAGWTDRSALELCGTPEGLRALAAALLELADRGPGRVEVALQGAGQGAGQGGGALSREWATLVLGCAPAPSAEAGPAVHVSVLERASDAHRRDKLVIELQNRLASTVRVSGYRFAADALRSAGNADLTILGGRTGRFTMFVPNDTKELELWVDGYTDLAGGGPAWQIGYAARTALPQRATRSPLEDRLM